MFNSTFLNGVTWTWYASLLHVSEAPCSCQLRRAFYGVMGSLTHPAPGAAHSRARGLADTHRPQRGLDIPHSLSWDKCSLQGQGFPGEADKCHTCGQVGRKEAVCAYLEDTLLHAFTLLAWLRAFLPFSLLVAIISFWLCAWSLTVAHFWVIFLFFPSPDLFFSFPKSLNTRLQS